MDENLAECLAFVRSGDPGAFSRLAEQYRPLVLSLVESFLSSMPPDSIGREDLIQEANIALYRAAIAYNTQQTNVTFGLFAKVCIRNRLISALRKQFKTAKKGTNHPGTPTQSSKDEIDWNSLKEQFDGILTKYEEQVLNLRLSNYSYKEIAEILKTDPKSIDNALYRIRRKLRAAQGNTE